MKWRRLRIAHILICGTLAAALPVFLWWLDRQAIGVEFSAHLSLKTALANTLPAYAAIALVGAMCGRFILSFALVSGLFAALYLVSGIKFQVLGDTVLLQDMYFLKSLDLASIQLFMPYLTHMSASALSGLLLLGVLGLAGFFFVEGKIVIPGRKTRIVTGLSGALVLSAILASAWPVNALYRPPPVRPETGFEPIFAVFRDGLVGHLLSQHTQTSRIDLDVDQNALADGLERLRQQGLWPSHQPGPASTRAQETPDIIVVLSESFIDPHIIGGMESVPDIIPHFRRIAAQARSGYMRVPTYGGGTVMTEFEVLTGMPLAAFPEVTFPWPELPMPHLPGLASLLAGQGYHTFALHANHWRFWNRHLAYPALGISDMIAYDRFEQRGLKDGLWHSDESMTDLVLDALQARAQTPVFAMVISMQAHGPYQGVRDSLRNQALYDTLALPPLSKDADETLRTYLYQIHAADQQLGRLVEALEARGRPWRLLFFGDHLPALPQVWNELGFTDRQTAPKQQVPWLIAGAGAGLDAPVGYSWQLPAALLETTGLMEPEGYLAFVAAISQAACCTEGRMQALPDDAALRAAAHANLSGMWKRHVHE